MLKGWLYLLLSRKISRFSSFVKKAIPKLLSENGKYIFNLGLIKTFLLFPIIFSDVSILSLAAETTATGPPL